MKVDMSPKAVTARLKTLDELWILSVKLMNSKRIKIEKEDKRRAKNNAKNLNPDFENVKL